MRKKRLVAFCMATAMAIAVPSGYYVFAETRIQTEDTKELMTNDTNEKEIDVKFQVDGKEVSVLKRTFSDTIQKEEVPANPIKEGYDFLGWYWGVSGQETKYEGIFPLNLSKIPSDVREKLGNQFVLQARFGHHTPANEKEKEGYRLIFDEEFDGSELDTTKWVDRYLSSWSTTFEETQGRKMKDGIMSLQINEETKPWCPEFDGATVISGFTTGQRNGLHNWNRNNIVRNPEDTQLTHINQYGYYEMRMKGQSGSARHSAWWLLGFEDVPEESAEIDIFEVLGRNDKTVPPAVHEWNDSNVFNGRPVAKTFANKDFNNEYHVYGFDWQQGTGAGNYPDKIIFYVDGEKYTEVNVNIKYPMIQLISLYEKRQQGAWTGNWEWMPYPNTMDIDYVRVYKKLPQGQKALPKSELKVTNIRSEDVRIPQNEVKLKTYQTETGVYTEKNLMGTKSYVHVTWNDGIETQEPVFWEEITQEEIAQLKAGHEVIKVGDVPSVHQKTTMIIHPVFIPYSSEGLVEKSNHALELLFDGDSSDSGKSGEFVADATTVKNMKEGKVAITYDFQKEVEIRGVDFYTNFGASQGIHKVKLQVWNEQMQRWEAINNPSANNEEVFEIGWKTEQEEIEKQSVTFESKKTNKIRIVILEVGTRWQQKFAMREIGFKKL